MSEASKSTSGGWPQRPAWPLRRGGNEVVVGQDRFGIPCWLVGEFTTNFRTYFSGDWDVHCNYRGGSGGR